MKGQFNPLTLRRGDKEMCLENGRERERENGRALVLLAETGRLIDLLTRCCFCGNGDRR